MYNIRGEYSPSCPKNIIIGRYFYEKCNYKSEWYGKNFLDIGQFEPSSKMCSVCGNIKSDLTLSDREWTCSRCGAKHDRDINASINIRNMAFTNQNLIRCIGLEQPKSTPVELLVY